MFTPIFIIKDLQDGVHVIEQEKMEKLLDHQLTIGPEPRAYVPLEDRK